MNSIVIGVDCSTTACKAIAWDARGRILSEARHEIPVRSAGAGEIEQDAESWWHAFCFAARQLTEQIDAREIATLCITHQRESFVPVDVDGSPIHPAILWLDERSHAEVDYLSRTYGAERIRDLTGKPLSTTPSLPKLIWLKKHKPEVISRAHKILDTHAFLVYKLTGSFRTSLPSADPMGIVDMESGNWANEFIAEIGLNANLFPEVHPAGSVIGKVTRGAAVETGLPEGLPVAAGAGDGQCAGLGGGVLGPGPAYLNLGTGVVSGVFSGEYQTGNAFRTLCAPVAGTFYLETVLKSGTRTIDWFLRTFGDGPGDAGTRLDELEREASSIPPGSDGLVIVPYWSGVMNPYWNPEAAGITLGWRDTTTRAHVYRAILEGIAFEQRLATEEVVKTTGQPVTEWRTTGGGSRSELWRQILADVFGIRLSLCSTPESTCLGAGIIAAVTAGWYDSLESAVDSMTGRGQTYEPDVTLAEHYGAIYEEVYRHLYPSLRDLSGRLRELSRGDG